MNGQASNGYVEQQQNTVPPEVMERLMVRYEVMNDKLIALLERWARKK